MSKSITIQIDPPITERCTKCDYEAHYSFHSHHCHCPKCGDSSVTGVYHSQMKPVEVYSNKGNYDFSHPSEEQFNYTFHNLPEFLFKGGRKSFVIDEELDTETPEECAREISDIIDKYLFSSSKGDAKELADYLESVQNRQYILRKAKRIDEAKRKLYELLK